MTRKAISRISVLLILLLAGYWSARRLRPFSINGSAREQLLPSSPVQFDEATTPGPAPGPQDVVVYAPVPAVAVDLTNLPPDTGKGLSKYERWLRGEIELEREYLIDPSEIAILQAEALALASSSRVQRMVSGPGLRSPTPGVSFDALDVIDCCGGGATVPPDPELAAGPSHLVAVVNVAFEIYDKNGTTLSGPTTFSTFFSPLGSANCTGSGPFDPNVLYDEANDRFMMAVDGAGRSYCIGVTQTGDPTGTWWLYEYRTDVGGYFFDFPHAGIGRDAIYMGANMFAGSTFAEGRIWAFDKAAMYTGLPAGAATRSTGSDGTPQPINLHGYKQGTWPTSGPHPILTDGDFNGAVYRLYAWSDPFGSNDLQVVGDTDLSAWHGVNVGFPIDSVQSGNGGTITSNDFRVLDFEYRNGSGWTAMTVSCNPGAGTVNCVQWAEIDLAGAVVRQAGVFASDATYRYFPDLAANQCDDMVIGYTRSSATSFPSVWVTGRKNSDPAGTVQAEVQVKAGEVTYAAFADRWGDYTGMTIDPDGRTFWYLGEYSKNVSSSDAKWGTHVGSVTFPDCSAVPDFALSAEPVTQSACAPADIGYTITVGSLSGFDDPVILNVFDAPSGYNSGLTQNPVIPSGTSVLTLTHASKATAGDYTIGIVGVAPTTTHTTTVGLELHAGVPGATTPLTPLDGAGNVSAFPQFTWTAVPDGDNYLLEVDTSADFNSVIYSATVSSPGHVITGPLAANTDHFWRVTSGNVCGMGPTSAVHRFSTGNVLCRAPAKDIPDDDSAGIKDSLVISANGTIVDLDVYLDIAHPWVGDLVVEVEHMESSADSTIVERPGVGIPGELPGGCGGDDIRAVIDDEGIDGSIRTKCDNAPALAGNLTPYPDALAAFDGGSLSGTWTLTVSDRSAADIGTLRYWCLLPSSPNQGPNQLTYFPVVRKGQ